MDILVNSYAVSPSNGDVRGEEPQWRTGKKPQDRFADIPVLADTTDKRLSDNNDADEADSSAEPQSEQGTLSSRKRADRSTPDDRHAATAAVALDELTGISVRTKRDAEKGDFASARSSKTLREEVVAVESVSAGQKQAATLGRNSRTGQHGQVVGDAMRKNGGFGTPLAGPSARRGNSPDTTQALDEPSTRTLSRKQSRAFAVSSRPEGKLQGPGAERQLRADSRRGSALGSRNASTEALLSRSRDAQSGSHKGGTKVPAEAGAYLVGPPAVARSPTFSTVATHQSAEGGGSQGVPQSVGEQILESLKASMAHGDRQILIRLEPPELGMVLVRFREQGEHLDGMFKVDRADTRREIEQVLPEVVRSLQDAGIGIRRIDVTDGDAPAQDLGGGQSQQEGSSGYRDAGQERDHFRASFMPGFSATAASSGDSRSVPDVQETMEVPRGRIDMLL